MALSFPMSPANGDRVILAGREYQFISPKWLSYKSVIIDSGLSTTVFTPNSETVDGGNANGI